MAESALEQLTGSIERVVFYNSENGYSVIRLRPGQRMGGMGLDREGLVTVTGNLPELNPGEQVRMRGRWLNHPKHGVQFQVDMCEQSLPATANGIRRYLGSGLIKGIGPRLADRIVDKFGSQTLDVIEQHPERLREVSDIGPKRIRQIAAAWEEQKQVKEIMLFLHSHGVSTNLAIKIYKQYGDEALGVVRSNPYRMARDIFGVGFKTADRIAQSLGLAPTHPARIEAGIVFVLNEMADNGHVYAPRPVLFEKARELLGVEAGLLPDALDRLVSDDRVHLDSLSSGPSPGSQPPDQTAVYLAHFFAAETGVAERLATFFSMKPLLKQLALTVQLDQQLSAEQISAIRSAFSHPISVLTGGPGTGKTTCLKALIASLETARKKYALASPTGRAAKRLSEATGRPASTIHRLLGFNSGEGFNYNSSNPLPVDMLVLDEVSMLDLLLANHLLKALRPGTHLLLVGDADQLPSVGAGDVLRDLINSGAVPVTRLSTIFRQAAHSMIITNAHRINQGQAPQFPPPGEADPQADFFLFAAEEPEEAADWVQQVVCERIPRKFGLDPLTQVQVLAPMYRGPAGVDALNARLQAALNPQGNKKPEKVLYGRTFRSGDKVMQIQNNYDKDIYNGDIGRVQDIGMDEQSMTVDFEGRSVTYDWGEADQLVLANAISVHKAQGSEFPAVVVPLLVQHYLMLQRNLIYTAVTRARSLCVLVGSRRALGMAVHNNQVAKRYTALGRRLQATTRS